MNQMAQRASLVICLRQNYLYITGRSLLTDTFWDMYQEFPDIVLLGNIDKEAGGPIIMR